MKREVDLGDHVLQIEATKKDVEKPLSQVGEEGVRVAIATAVQICESDMSTDEDRISAAHFLKDAYWGLNRGVF